MIRKLAWPVLGFVLLGCAPEQESVESLGTGGECKPLGTECRAARDKRLIGLRLPPEIQPLTRFPITVRLEGIDAHAVTVQFEMKSMDMGVNRFTLHSRDGAWTGEAILPVCTSGRADWIATVRAATGAGSAIEARFDFETKR